MQCSNCGREINKDTNYCPYCGSEVEYKVDISESYTQKKINSDSENQPTNALVWLGLAILSCVYSFFCISEESEDFASYAIFAAMVFVIISYRKLKKHKEIYGLNGIGYVAYLICRIVLPVIIIFVVIFLLVVVMSLLRGLFL